MYYLPKYRLSIQHSRNRIRVKMADQLSPPPPRTLSHSHTGTRTRMRVRWKEMSTPYYMWCDHSFTHARTHAGCVLIYQLPLPAFYLLSVFDCTCRMFMTRSGGHPRPIAMPGRHWPERQDARTLRQPPLAFLWPQQRRHVRRTMWNSRLCLSSISGRHDFWISQTMVAALIVAEIYDLTPQRVRVTYIQTISHDTMCLRVCVYRRHSRTYAAN